MNAVVHFQPKRPPALHIEPEYTLTLGDAVVGSYHGIDVAAERLLYDVMDGVTDVGAVWKREQRLLTIRTTAAYYREAGIPEPDAATPVSALAERCESNALHLYQTLKQMMDGTGADYLLARAHAAELLRRVEAKAKSSS